MIDRVTCDREDISHNSAGCRHLTGSSAIEHDISHCIAAYIDGIVGTVHCRDRVGLRDQHRMHPDLDSFLPVRREANQLDDPAKCLCVSDVLRCDFRDPLRVHIPEGDSGMKRDGRHDGHLSGRVIPLDISGRIRLRIAQRGRLSQRLLIVHPLIGHLGQDEVCRPVDDSHDLADLVGGQAVLQRGYDRDAAGYGSLKPQLRMIFLGDLHQLSAPLRNQILVRGDNAFSRLESVPDIGAGRFNAADQLDDDVDVRIIHNL